MVCATAAVHRKDLSDAQQPLSVNTRSSVICRNPNRTVFFGEPTTDEMMFGWIDYTETD